MGIYWLGLIWDTYTPAVEGQIIRDILALQASSPKTEIAVVVPNGSANQLLNSMGIRHCLANSLATLWIVYKTKPDSDIEAPEHVDRTIERNLYVETKECLIDGDPHPGYYLKPQGRMAPPSMPLNRPPPTNSRGVINPTIIMLWS